MAQIAVNPLFLKDVVLTIGSDSYEKHVSSVAFNPSAGTQTWKGLNPDSVFTFATSPTWECAISYAQDWATVNSLSRYLFDHAGETVTMVFKPAKPASGTAPTFTADIVIQPGAIGGAVDSVGTATVTLGVKGKPAYSLA